MLSEWIREPAKRMGGAIRSCRVQWFEERADEVAKLERVVKAAKVLDDLWNEELTGGGSCKAQMEFDEWICKVGIAEGELSTALADLGALGG